MRLRKLIILLGLAALLAPAQALALPNAGSNAMIVFARGPAGAHDLYVANADGSGSPVQLTNDPADDVDPAVSPDGTRIVFASNRSGVYNLFVINADGTGSPIRLTAVPHDEHDPAWSPDGNTLVYSEDSGDASKRLDLLSLPASGTTPSTSVASNAGDDVAASYSPDGAWIIWASGGTIWEKPANGSGIQTLYPGGGESSPTWSPTSARWAYVEGGTIRVLDTSAAGLVDTHVPVAGRISWSPDGSSILFFDTGTNRLSTMRVSDSSVQSLGWSNANDRAGDWLAGLVNLSVPHITSSGTTLDLASTLVADPGVWQGGSSISYTYQWERCNPPGANGCQPIIGATTSTYAPTVTDLNAALRVFVTATSPVGTATAASAGSGPIGSAGPPPANTVVPVIAGLPVIGQTLAATSGVWSDTGARLSYQWSRCSPAGTACQAIAGAMDTSYDATDDDAAFSLVVTVTATNIYGSATTSSLPTAVIGAMPADPGPGVPASTVGPGVVGPPVIGGKLSATTGGFVGAGLKYAYQWQRCDTSASSCSSIQGATKSSYTPKQPDLGSTIRVVVTASNSLGSASAYSDTTSAVAAAPAVATRTHAARTVVLRGTARADRLVVRRGTTRVAAGAGNDRIAAADRRQERIDCGPGRDIVTADRIDVLVGCELVRHPKRAPARKSA